MARHSQLVHRRRQYWYFKHKNEAGDWIERTTHSVDYHEGLRIRAEFLRKQEEGRLPNDRSRWTLKQAIAEWLNARKLRVANGTYLSEGAITRNLSRVLGEETTLITLATIQAVHRYESCRLGCRIGAKTVNNEMLVFKGILRDANLWHRIDSFYKPLKVLKSEIGAALTREEAYKLLQFAKLAHPNSVAAFAAVLAYATGMRSKEIMELQRGSVHLEASNPFLYVRRSTTKSDKGARHVALDKMACWALSKLLDRAQLLGVTNPNHFVFPTLLEKHTRAKDPLNGGKGYDPTHPQSSWGKEWSEVRKAVGIEHLRFHDLRHSYITRAAEAGVPLPVIQAQVGHMSVQMVEHYTHICQAAIHRAAAQIEEQSVDLLSKLGFSQDGEMEAATTKIIQ
jgi:integrase